MINIALHNRSDGHYTCLIIRGGGRIELFLQLQYRLDVSLRMKMGGVRVLFYLEVKFLK